MRPGVLGLPGMRVRAGTVVQVATAEAGEAVVVAEEEGEEAAAAVVAAEWEFNRCLAIM